MNVCRVGVGGHRRARKLPPLQTFAKTSLAFDQQSPTMNALLSYIRFDVNSPPLSYVCIFLDRSTQKNKKMERALQRFSADLKGFTSKVADNVASLKRGAESRPYGGGERDGGAEGQLSAAR